VVDCNDAGSKECHHAKHAANAFDTEKVALMHGIFQLLQIPLVSLIHPGFELHNPVLHAICLIAICYYLCTGPLHMHGLKIHCCALHVKLLSYFVYCDGDS